MVVSVVLVAMTAVLAISVGWLVVQLVPRPLAGIPRLPGTQLVVGDVGPLLTHFQQTSQFHLYFEQLIRRGLGGERGFYQFFWPGSLRTPSVVLTDWNEAQDILSRRHAEFERSPSTRDVFKALLPYGLLSIDAQAMWRQHKRLLLHTMAPKNMKSMAPTIIRTARRLMDLWEARLALGPEVVEIEGDLSAFTTDVISDIVFGAGYHQLEEALFQLTRDPEAKAGASPFAEGARLAECSKIFFACLPAEAIFPGPAMLWTRLTTPAVGQAERFFHETLRVKIADGRSRVRLGEGKHTVLDTLLEKEWEEVQQGLKPMSEMEIRDELMTMLIAGDETTSSTMCWLLQYLAQSPAVQVRLHEEIIGVLPSSSERELSLDDLASQPTPYLDSVIHETLRVAKTVSALYRTTLIDTTVLGVPVPKGTDVIILSGLMGVLGRGLDDVPDDIEQFRPDRWLTPDGDFDPKSLPAIPFSKGHRECIGRQLAMVELRVFTALLSQSFFLDALPKDLADKEASLVKETVTRRPSGGVSVKLRRWDRVL